MSINEELFDGKVAAPDLKISKINGRGDPLRWPRYTLHLQKMALTSPTSGGHSVGFCLRTKATDAFMVILQGDDFGCTRRIFLTSFLKYSRRVLGKYCGHIFEEPERQVFWFSIHPASSSSITNEV
jgi:hypothetical protein